MPTFHKIALILAPALVLLGWLPSEAQNLGGRGRTNSVRGVMPQRSAPQRSAPQRSAPQRSAPQRSAPQRTTTRVSAPQRNYAPAQSSRNRTSTRPLVRQSIPQATGTSTASAGQRSTRVNGVSPRTYTPGSSNRVTGMSPGATYPGRINNSAARTNGNVVRGLPNGTVQRQPVLVAPANSAFSDGNRVTGYSPRGNRTRANNTTAVVNNGPSYANRPVYYNNNRNGYRVNRYVRQNSSPYYRGGYSPYAYSNYNYRRYNRYYQPCAVPFLSLGFFMARPYSYYNYASIDYSQPFVYGEDTDYRSAPIAVEQVASTQPTAAPTSLEQDLLTELARYVDTNSQSQRFQVADPAFGNQIWNLDLTQAPAVYSIDANHYSVVAGFEGTLGDNTIPSSVGMEFFVARDQGRWAIKQAWIVSANGIPRAKRFRSPVYAPVQTWQAGQTCPFSGQPMIEVSESSSALPSGGPLGRQLQTMP